MPAPTVDPQPSTERRSPAADPLAGPSTAPPRPAAPGRRVGRVVVRVAISVGLLVLIYVLGGRKLVTDVGANLRAAAAHPWLLVAAVVLYAGLGTVIRGLRWQALVRPLGHPISLWRSSELFMVGTFFNQILPTGVGGDAVKAMLLARDGRANRLGAARAVSTVLVDRGMGLLPLLAFGLIALPFTPGVTPAVAVFLAVIGLGGVTGLALLMRADLWWSRVERWPIAGWVLRRAAVARFVGSFAEYGVRALAASLGWGIVFTVLLVGTNAALGHAVGIDSVSVATWATVVPLVALSAMLPSIGGWGVREMGYWTILGALTPPVAQDKAVAVSLLFQAVNMLVSIAGGLLYLFRGDHVASPLADAEDLVLALEGGAASGAASGAANGAEDGDDRADVAVGDGRTVGGSG
ncbi:MAG: lysylphosphatidylglycerol synthase transmembrane domain-containing protein [Ardenticatenales bacterium]